MLRGREAEQSALGALIERAFAGDGAALVLRGQPGVGKSALLDDAVTAARDAVDGRDVTVLRTRGVESEGEF